jgi:hypothetical protein
MKILTSILAGAAVVLSPFASQAITNSAIAISGTNVVLSWPSQGYESYLVQYRPTLAPSDSWSQMANAYPANSTNRTTFTIYGVVSSPSSGGGTNSGGGNIPIPIPGDTNSYSGGTDTNVMPVQAGFFRVFHIPDFLADFSNYTFDGPTFVPVDFASPDAPVDNVESSTVFINGQPTDIATLIPYVISGVTNWGMGIYFDRLPNGTNTIQLITTVRQSDTLNDQTPYMVFSNAPAAINIGNFVTYTNWADLALSNTYTFNAHCKYTNIDWEIDIYDVNSQLVNYQTGHSDDGNISWTWDFTDDNGDSRVSGNSDPFFYPYITISQTSGNIANGQVHPNTGGGSSSSWMPPVASQYPDEGAWLFAYMDKFYDDGTSNYAGADSYYLPAIQNLEGGPLLWGTVTYDAPIKYGRDYSQDDRNGSWDSLRDDLQSWNARNFYYFGHGAANSFGGDFNELDASNNIVGSDFGANTKAYITAQWVHDNVTYNKTWGAMPFRFVFLDGCNTAIGNWPWAWGVPKQSVNTDWYKNSTNNPKAARPNAFLGWDVTVGGKKENWGTVDKFWQFRSDWIAQWSVSYVGYPLSSALDDARDFSSWVPGQVNAHLKKYGYTTMGFQQYNQAGDWP